MRFQRTCYARDQQGEAGCQVTVSTAPIIHRTALQPVSPFSNMRSIQESSENGINKDNLYGVTQEIFTKVTPKNTVIKSNWSVRTTTYAPGELQIPSFREYVSLKTSILADNESKLLTIPWLGDDEPQELHDVLLDDLPKRYEIRHDINPFLDLRNEQCQFYFDAVESFLTEVGVTWDSMLYWLLSSDESLRRINESSDRYMEFEHLILDRSGYDKEAFNRRLNEARIAVLFERGPNQWLDLLHQLEKPSAVQLRLIALASSALRSKCGFSPWFMAKQSTTMKEYVYEKTTTAEAMPGFTFRGILCRICHE
jgi:hypothetical protein